ncbi:ABC transporter ATP-binding protein [Parachlamydia sp. AcF125]|uniref:ABC transporter ATP-binding protein n=1 Tax=Parachlamydia sp. AcF125 TaxID=2795736 RepID=UPI001BCA3177|nr:ABC transporter ATP-binding protein [Parachlamydia sp. AcF125]MBS4169075.1 putative multidrug export ATP-binding/permease protein [Parachlamydia sp. AcF125]
MSSIPNTLPKFLWYFARRYKLCLSGFVLVAIYWASSLSLKPYAMKLIIDRVSNCQNPESLFSAVIFPALLYVGLNLLMGLIFRFYDWLVLSTFPEMEMRISEEMFGYVEKHSYSYFQQNFAGSLGNKINDISKGTGKVITHLIDHFLACTLGLIIGMITMFLIHPYFAYLMFAWSVIFISVSLLLSKKAQSYSKMLSEARSTVVGKIVDSIGNILNVKLFAREGYENQYLHNYLEKTAKIDRQGQWYLLKVKFFYILSIAFLTAAMVGILIYERSKNSITVGDFALILTLNMFLIELVFFIANQLVPFSEVVGTCQQALSIISTKHEIVDMPGARPLQISKGQIVFEKVHFQYRKGQRIFSDKSIIIHPRERVGLVGFSGSGKSTFVNLILRFFEVDSGKIWIDGQDIKSVTQESLRSQIALIPQDPLLFHRSLAENIGYGRLGASMEEIVEAAKKAHCHQFIEELQDGYQTLVGERGIKLSGGQRQRIAIARAILKNAPILILDEATSSLDSITENDIQESLALLMRERTTLVIAHRLSTLFHMDRILVFSEGKVIEDGTHAELLGLNGPYAKLWSMQAYSGTI